MNGRPILSVSIALLVLGSIGAVGLAAAGTAPAAGSPAAQTGTGTGTGTVQANGTSGPFNFSVQQLESCGVTCRQVTATLTNEGNDTARNVTVTSTILAGDTVIVERRTQVDSLAPNESVTRTVFIHVSPDDVRAIRQNQGQITIRTVVTSQQHNETFVTNRTVL